MKTYWTDNIKGSRGYPSDREIVLLPDHANAIEAKDAELSEKDRRIAELEGIVKHECRTRDDQMDSVRTHVGTLNQLISDLRAELAVAESERMDATQRAWLEHLESELTTARAEAQRNADAAEALAGLERLGGKHCLSYNDAVGRWEILLTVGNDNMFEVFAQAPTALAAVRAAEEAKG